MSVLSRQCLSERIENVERLEREVSGWQKRRDVAATTADWRFTTPDARIKLKKLYPSLHK